MKANEKLMVITYKLNQNVFRAREMACEVVCVNVYVCERERKSRN